MLMLCARMCCVLDEMQCYRPSNCREFTHRNSMSIIEPTHHTDLLTHSLSATSIPFHPHSRRCYSHHDSPQPHCNAITPPPGPRAWPCTQRLLTG